MGNMERVSCNHLQLDSFSISGSDEKKELLCLIARRFVVDSYTKGETFPDCDRTRSRNIQPVYYRNRYKGTETPPVLQISGVSHTTGESGLETKLHRDPRILPMRRRISYNGT